MEWQSRQISLIGEEKTQKLRDSSVLVFGAGGVGGYVIEALARCGIGKISVVDRDTVALSNLNRQILATTKTVGELKAECAARRILEINPDCTARAVAEFVTPENAGRIIDEAAPDFIVDAIDCVTAKIAIVMHAKEHDIPIICAMGTGNKLDPAHLKIADLSKTSMCPLAKVMRLQLRRRGVNHLTVLFSDEQPVKTGSRTPASISFVPATGGLLMAGHVVRELIK